MSVNSEYRCPSCREQVQAIASPGNVNNKVRIGVIHSPTCKLFKSLAFLYPDLVARIEEERGAA